MKKMDTYKIIKLDSSKINRYFKNDNGEYEIELSYKDAVKNAYIISRNGSQLTRHLESMGRVINKPSISRSGKPIVDSDGKQKQVRYIPDIVSICFDYTPVFTQMRKKCLRKRKPYGFTLNGNEYSRLFTPSGNGRKSTSIYVNNAIKEELLKKCMNGLTLTDIYANGAKFNAYIGLCVSGSYKVSPPRACVIEDFKLPIMIKSHYMNNDYQIDEGDDGSGKEYEIIKNCFDGMGLIDPVFAKNVWSKDLECDYTPCGWVIRNAYLKGAVFNFDFKAWARTRETPIKTITDIYGKKHFIEDIDVILTESQFKMASCYAEINEHNIETWDYYRQCCEENGNVWGITKVSPKVEKEISTTNYQFLQTLELSREQIIGLCRQSVDYLNECFENDKTALELIAHQNGGIIPAYVKAVELYQDAINDPYIIKKINEVIRGQIKDMCLGRLRVFGNYQFMINDPVAFCEWAFYKKRDMVKGILSKKEYYANYWRTKEVNQVSAIRAPNIHFSEHNTLDFVTNRETLDWFRHLPSGIIYNIYGDDPLRHSGSDTDGDMVFTSTSSELINGTVPHPVIDFEHPDAITEKLSEEVLFKADEIGFDVDIGLTVNRATICINMMANYDKESAEYKELERRAKILTASGQLTIDAQKGCEVLGVPDEWFRYQPILTENYYCEKFNRKSLKLFGITLEDLNRRINLSEDERKLLDQYEKERQTIDNPETIKRKKFDNSILLNKKPYFFIYKDKVLREEYKDYKNSLRLRNPRDNPVNDGEAPMNQVCREIERHNHELKLNQKSQCSVVDEKWIYLMRDHSIRRSKSRYEAVKKEHSNYTSAKRLARTSAYSGDSEDKILTHSAVDDCYRNLFLEKVDSEAELANILIELLYQKQPSSDKAALWKFAGNAVIENIKRNLEEK